MMFKLSFAKKWGLLQLQGLYRGKSLQFGSTKNKAPDMCA